MLLTQSIGRVNPMINRVQSAEAPSVDLPSTSYRQPLLWALLLTIGMIFAVWGFFSQDPLRIVLWIVAALAILILVISIFLQSRSLPQLKAVEVRRLVACRDCDVESEGPFQAGDYIFREIGECPRCGGPLYIKALYSVDSKTPLVRQQPLEKSAKSEDSPKK